MTVIKTLIILLLAVTFIIATVLIVGSLWSLDWQRSHREAAAALPRFDADSTDGLVMIETNGMQFRARIAGMHNPGPGVILLHGFPETSAMWDPLIATLAGHGFRVVAFDQRGYSPGARPAETNAYAIDQLVSDVYAVAATAGFPQFHLVGHDWGAAVGWAAAIGQPVPLLSYTSLSIPHVAAFADALDQDPDQQRRSRYMMLFRTPWLPEVLFTFNRLALMNAAMYGSMSQAQRDEYNTVFAEPGALTGALNWYRANNSFATAPMPPVTVPVLFIWGNQDPAVGAAGVAAQHKYITGPFESHELDAGHWLMEEATDEVAAIVLAFLQAIEQTPATPLNDEAG